HRAIQHDQARPVEERLRRCLHLADADHRRRQDLLELHLEGDLQRRDRHPLQYRRKFLVIGKLNFAGGALSITARLYADLSKIASGEATVLFLADIPDQVQLLTIDGRFKMGFRNPETGEEVAFKVVDAQTGKPYAKLAGPIDGGAIGEGTFAGRGYIDVTIPDGPSGAVLNLATVTALAPEFRIDDADSAIVHLDNTQAPVLVSGSTFRYWLRADSGAPVTISIVWLKEAW